MTTLLPTPLEEAAKAMHSSQPWSSFWSADDALLLATAAITAYLAQREKEGWVMVPVEPERIVIDRAVAFALNVSLTGDYNWSAYMTDLYRRMIHAALQEAHRCK